VVRSTRYACNSTLMRRNLMHPHTHMHVKKEKQHTTPQTKQKRTHPSHRVGFPRLTRPCNSHRFRRLPVGLSEASRHLEVERPDEGHLKLARVSRMREFGWYREGGGNERMPIQYEAGSSISRTLPRSFCKCPCLRICSGSAVCLHVIADPGRFQKSTYTKNAISRPHSHDRVKPSNTR
jgi:hypothetical protein